MYSLQIPSRPVCHTAALLVAVLLTPSAFAKTTHRATHHSAKGRHIPAVKLSAAPILPPGQLPTQTAATDEADTVAQPEAARTPDEQTAEVWTGAATPAPTTAAAAPAAVPVASVSTKPAGPAYSLKLAAVHTGESLEVVYRIGDTYIPEAVAKLNHLLRDRWNNQDANYDPRAFDLLHNVLTRLGRPQSLIDVMCGYRSAESNAALRHGDPRTGVAEHSQHIEGHAIDITVPGVSTSTLRTAALSLDAGGVGYYPHNQFVHVDVGPVRQWTFKPVKAHRGKKGHHKHKRA